MQAKHDEEAEGADILPPPPAPGLAREIHVECCGWGCPDCGNHGYTDGGQHE